MAEPEPNEFMNIRVFRKDKPRLRELAERLIKWNAHHSQEPTIWGLMLMPRSKKLRVGAVDDAQSLDLILCDYEKLLAEREARQKQEKDGKSDEKSPSK